MDFGSRRAPRRVSNPVDDWLRNEGYFRKNSYNDATCLFRAVSEQIYMTQYYHFKVRKECVDFMKKNPSLFEKDMKIPLEKYLKAMACASEWGGEREIRAMSLLYKREFVLYDGNKMIRSVLTNNGSDKFIYLCQIGQRRYESVFEREAISSAAFCQSIVYQTLYKGVFKIDGIDETADKMLHDTSLNIRHDKYFLQRNLSSRDDLKVELLNKLENKENKVADGNAAVESDGQEIPYKVAKALDPNIYRNTELDVWHELTRGVRSAGWSRWNSSELQVGGKCYVRIETEKILDTQSKDLPAIEENKEENKDSTSKEIEKIEKISGTKTKEMIGHIQEIGKNQGPVVVFIEELGKKMTVPFSALKAMIPRKKQPYDTINVVSVRKNHSYNSTYKWNSSSYNKKQWISNNRKSKELHLNGMDQLNNNNNEVNHNSTSIKKNENHENNHSSWNKNQKLYSPISVMKKLTSIDNYSPKNLDKTIDAIEVRPVSVVYDNNNPQQPRDSPQSQYHSDSNIPYQPLETSQSQYHSSTTPSPPDTSTSNNTSGNSNSKSNSNSNPQNSSSNNSQQNLSGGSQQFLSSGSISSLTVSTNLSAGTNNSHNESDDVSKSAGYKSEVETGHSGVPPSARSTPVPLQQHDIHLQGFNSQQQIFPANSGPQMVAPNTGLVYITPDGNIYPSFNYYGGFVPESAPIVAPTPSLLPAPAFSQEQLNRVNLSPQLSYDANGADLPLPDLNTLRYFYNIGVECHYRNNTGGICQAAPAQYAYGTPGVVQRGNYLQMIPAPDYQTVQAQPQVVQQPQQLQQQIQSQPQIQQVQQSQQQVQSSQQQVQQQSSSRTASPSHSNSAQRQNNQQNRRRNDSNPHATRGHSNYYGNGKHSSIRNNDCHAIIYHRDEEHAVYDQQKIKNNLDFNSGSREQKKNPGGNANNNNGRYRKNNDTRNRTFERPVNSQPDYQRKQTGNYQGNHYNNRHVNEGTGQHRGKVSDSSLSMTPSPPIVNNNSSSNSPPAVPSSSGGTGSAPPPPISTNVTQFYQNYPPPPPPPSHSSYPFESFCQQNQNYYPVPAMVAPHEGNSQTGPYVCAGMDNYQPVFHPYVFPPPTIYQSTSPAQGPEHWYPVPGNQQPPLPGFTVPFMPPGFTQISVPPPQQQQQQPAMKPPTSN